MDRIRLNTAVACGKIGSLLVYDYEFMIDDVYLVEMMCYEVVYVVDWYIYVGCVISECSLLSR